MKKNLFVILFILLILTSISYLIALERKEIEKFDTASLGKLVSMKNVLEENYNYNVPDLVPFDSIKEIVKRIAQKRWGNVSIGEAIPCCDEYGNIRVYMFPICITSKVFPSEVAIFNSVIEGSKLYLKRARIKAIRNVMLGVNDYKTIIISARFKEFPVPAIFHSLPPYYSFLPLALNKAKKVLGESNLKLKCFYFLGYRGAYFEFSTNKRNILISADLRLIALNKDEFFHEIKEKPIKSFLLEKQETILKKEQRISDKIREEWQKLLVGNVQSSDRHYIKKDWVPILNWTGGCTPTSAAMALGYWDNYSFSNGGWIDEGECYGRLIDYYTIMPFSFCKDYNSYNIDCPNILHELREAMDTNCPDNNNNGQVDDDEIGFTKGENISVGIEDVTNNINGYNFTSQRHYCLITDLNEWLWNIIKNEVDNSRPFVYSVLTYGDFLILPGKGHSMCGIGYTDDKYVIVIDPNGAYEADWQYFWWEYKPEGLAKAVQVDTIEPGGNQYPNQLVLKSPQGNEKISAGSPFSIIWKQWGDSIKGVKIYFSSKGGNRGAEFITTYPSFKGENEYPLWTPNVATITGRIEIRESDSQYPISDGSKGLFEIIPSGILPSDEARIDTLTPTFEWTPWDSFYERLGYQLRVRCDSDGDKIVYDTGFVSDKNSTTHTYQPGAYTGFDSISESTRVSEPLEYGKHYHWHIRYYFQVPLGDSYGNFWASWSNDNPDAHQDFYIVVPDIRTPIEPINFPDTEIGKCIWYGTTIYNDGSGSLTINEVPREFGSTDFTYAGPSTPFSIPAKSSKTITIKFCPSTGLLKSATFNVNSNDPDEKNVQFNVSGKGKCIYSLNPKSKDFPADGGNGSFEVQTQSPCSWTAVSNASWIHITSGSNGQGDGTVEFS
ncbi:MAG: C39 family peptidase, partial [Promethearchaeota archaeon]